MRPDCTAAKRPLKGILRSQIPAQGLREGPGEIDLKADVLPIPRLELPGHIADVRPHHQGLRAKALGRDQTPRRSRAQAPRRKVTLTVHSLPFFPSLSLAPKGAQPSPVANASSSIQRSMRASSVACRSAKAARSASASARSREKIGAAHGRLSRFHSPSSRSISSGRASSSRFSL